MDLSTFSLWLFDMDGLLVDTEYLHLEAYKRMCASRGLVLEWTLPQFLQIAHKSSSAIKEKMLDQFPVLRDCSWETLYKEKKKQYLECLASSPLRAMPGAELMILYALDLGVRSCVVTHSPKEQTQLIREKLPFLNQIPNWITREDYGRAKPDPQCYKKAIDLYGLPQKAGGAIGFEDSARGLTALMGTSSQAVLVAKVEYPQLKPYQGRFLKVGSFIELLKQQKNLPMHIKTALED